MCLQFLLSHGTSFEHKLLQVGFSLLYVAKTIVSVILGVMGKQQGMLRILGRMKVCLLHTFKRFVEVNRYIIDQ